MSRRANPTAIGAFVLGAIALALVGAILFGSGLFRRDTADFILFFPESVNGLDVGAPVKFKGVQLGRVTQILLGYEQKPGPSQVTVLIQLDKRTFGEKSFNETAPDLSSRADMKRAVDRGLRAQLEASSLVTGLLYVELSVRPETEARFEQQGDQYVEIPTIPSNLQQVFDNLELFARRLDKIDVESLVEAYTKLGQNADQLVQNVDKVVTDPKIEELLASVAKAAGEVEQTLRVARGKVGPISDDVSAAVADARATLDRIRALVESAESVIRPDSPLRYQVSNVLSELQNTARALRNLADLLERDPQALLTGKNPLEP